MTIFHPLIMKLRHCPGLGNELGAAIVLKLAVSGQASPFSPQTQPRQWELVYKQTLEVSIAKH